MKELFEAIEREEKKELARAVISHGSTLASPHEAFAVILEELQEGVCSLGTAAYNLSMFWNGVRADDREKQIERLVEIERNALLAACEFVQTSAMARKAMKLYEDGEK